MNILIATTTLEARDAFVAVLQSNAEGYRTLTYNTLADKRANQLRATLLDEMAAWLKDCVFHDVLNRPHPTPTITIRSTAVEMWRRAHRIAFAYANIYEHEREPITVTEALRRLGNLFDECANERDFEPEIPTIPMEPPP